MKFSDVKLLLPSSGYMKTSEVDGRTVIDEMRDASYERNHQSFVGDDRPELHQDLDGNFFTSVEKESTNLFLNSDTLSTQGVEVTADPYTVSFEGAGTITFSGAHTGSLEGIEGERVEATFTPSAGTLTCTVSGEVLKAQIEQSAYATLYIPTSGTPVTRLAPSPVIENLAPATGIIWSWFEHTGSDDGSMRVLFNYNNPDFVITRRYNRFRVWINGVDSSNIGQNVFMGTSPSIVFLLIEKKDASTVFWTGDTEGNLMKNFSVDNAFNQPHDLEIFSGSVFSTASTRAYDVGKGTPQTEEEIKTLYVTTGKNLGFFTELQSFMDHT